MILMTTKETRSGVGELKEPQYGKLLVETLRDITHNGKHSEKSLKENLLKASVLMCKMKAASRKQLTKYIEAKERYVKEKSTTESLEYAPCCPIIFQNY